MSTDLQPLMFKGYNVRAVTGHDGEPWFVLNDVCKVLGIGNPRDVAYRLDDDQKGVDSIDTPGGVQQMAVVNEIGLISVIMRSDKPIAKEFQRAAIEYIKSVGHHGVALAGVSSDNMARLMADPDSATLLELVRVRAEQLDLVSRTTEIEKQLASLGDLRNSYMSVIGWFNYNGGTVSNEDAQILGKIASKICRKRGIEIGHVKHERWGQVQSYPESVIAEAYEQFKGRY